MKNKLQFSKMLLMLFLVISFQKSFAQANEPTNLVATVGVNSVSVAFTTPTTVVGGAITNYEYSLDNGSSWVAMSPAQTNSPLAITGLTNCINYSIKIRAVNISGAGSASSAVTVTPQNGQQSGVKWTFRNLQVNNYWVAATYGNGLFVSVGISTGTVMTSPDGITWTSRTLTNSNRWLSVTYGNGLFVAVGDNGNSTGSATDFVMTSPDGITWTSRTPPLSSNGGWNSVTYGNGLFIAVGYGKVMKSLDGINWTNSTAPANNWVNCTYGNGLFVAVANMGSGDFVMTSSDGITWTSRTAAANIYWSSVIYGNGLFVAVANYGTGNRVMTSPDGINWTLRASADNSQEWKSVTYGNGQFVAVSYSTNDLNQVMTSPDGMNWTIQTVTRNYQWQSITYGNGLFLVVSAAYGTMTSTEAFAPDTPTINTIIPSGFSASVSFTAPTSSGFSDISNYEYSLDNGINWVTPSPAVTTSPLRIGGLSSGTTYPIQLRAVNTAGASCASATVNTTTLVPIVPNEPTNVVATAGLNAVSIEFTVPTNDGGADITNYEYTINDGLSWTALSSITSPLDISGLTGCTNYTIKIRAVNAVGGGAASTPITVTPQNGQAADGITWTSRTAIQDNYWSSITYGNGQFVVVSGGGGGVMTSPDAINWTSRTAIQDYWNSVTYGNGQFVAVSNNGVMTSPDGITWTSRALPQSGWYSVTYGNGLFVAVGSGVMTSPDGITWTSRTIPENTWVNSVTYGNGQFVAVGGYSGMTSPDGITWTSSNVQSFLSSVTFGNGLFVAAGWNELVTSPDGIIWTSRIYSNDYLSSVTYGNGLFVATMNNSVKTSLDGITWTDRAAVQGYWRPVTYGNGQFVAVSGDGVMTNSATISPSQPVINSITPTINSASVVFSAPENSGTSAISNYEYSLDNGSTWITPSPAVTTSPLTIAGLTSGTTYPIQLRALNSAGASCASGMLSTTTLSPVAPPTASDQTFCGSKTVADLKAIGTDLKWYDAETGGNVLTSSTVLASGTYYVSQTENDNESERTSVAVTLHAITGSAQTISQCGAYTWPTNNQTYTQSGTYTGVVPNAAGCDSTITLNLTILSKSTHTVTVATCVPYSWNNKTYTKSGTYWFITKNSKGCDSIVKLVLTITPSGLPKPTISGPSILCWTSKAGYNASVAGGTWATTDNYMSLISTLGIVRSSQQPPVDMYKSSITYTIYNQDKSCSEVATKNIWIKLTPASSVTITTASSVQKGKEVTLTSNRKNGIWATRTSLSKAPLSITKVNSNSIKVKGLEITPNPSGTYVLYVVEDTVKKCTNTGVLSFNVTKASALVSAKENQETMDAAPAKLSIFPNPTNGKITIENGNAVRTVKLIDMTGKMVMELLDVNTMNTIDFNGVAPGKYMVKLEGDHISEIHSIVITQ